jgi:hypothetical protein
LTMSTTDKDSQILQMVCKMTIFFCFKNNININILQQYL